MLKIGVIICDTKIPIWQYRTIEGLLSAKFIEIIQFFKINENSISLLCVKNSVLSRWYEKLDKYFFQSKFDFDKIIDASDLINEVETFDINIKGNEYFINDYFLKYIQKLNFDLILNFSQVELKYKNVEIAKYGIWSYEIGDSEVNNGSKGDIWEFFKQLPDMGANLKLSLPNNDNKVTIQHISTRLYPNSLHINRNRLYGTSSSIIYRNVKGVYLYGNTFIEKQIEKFNKYNPECCEGELKSHSSLQVILSLIQIFLRFVLRRIIYSKHCRWVLYFMIDKKQELFPLDFRSFNKIVPPRDRFWADPFPICYRNTNYVFVEELLFKNGKGHISVLELDIEGNLKKTISVIEKDYHLSYPFILNVEDSLYMVPESSENKTIELYKCIHFPETWVFVKNIMNNVAAVDTSLFFYDNKWWLFTSIDNSDSRLLDNELFLFWSDSLFSDDWKEHPFNPIVSDAGRARSAGRIFVYEDKIYRPSQDCSGRYGKVINFNQITKLTIFEYEEILITKINPDWDKKLKGMHTFNFSNNMIVIDAYSFRKRIPY